MTTPGQEKLHTRDPLVIEKGTIARLLVLVAVAFAGFGLFASASLDNEDYFSTDSVAYRDLAINNCGEPWTPLNNVVANGDPISLNWATIVSVGAVACSIDRAHFGFLIVLLNLSMFCVLLTVYARIARALRLRSWLFIVAFALQWWLIASVPSLNKEVLSYLVIALLAYFYVRQMIIPLLFVALFAGMVKVQFFAFGAMLVASLMGVGFWKQFLFLAAVMTFAKSNFHFLDLEEFYRNYEGAVRTEALTLWVNQLLDYPLGFSLAMPVRTVLNLVAGFSPARILEMGESWQALAYQINALLLGFVTLALAWQAALNPGSFFRHLLTKFFALYCLLLAILPFIQSRYFLPILPVMLLMLAVPTSRPQQQARS